MKKPIAAILTFALAFSLLQIPVQAAWKQQGSNWYYTDNSGKNVTGWKQVGSTWYYFNSQGVMQTGWLKSGNSWYYLNASGAMTTGWVQIGGVWYFMNASGVMQTGWVKSGSTWYYMNTSGAMVTGTVTIDGKQHKFDASGVWLGEVPTAKNGWVQESGSWYYYKNGTKATGWLQDGGVWYFMNASGVMQTGWVKSGSTWYYMNTSGAMVTGTVTIDGKQHKFDASGAWLGEVPAAKNGWVQESGSWYYYKNGTKATGWLQDGGVWYFMNASGVMQTGWVKSGSTWYYMNTSGAMVTGWQTIGADTYYFYGSGEMATDAVIDGITIGSDGKAQQPSDDVNDPPAPPATATITIGLPMKAVVMEYETNALTQWLEAETGYNIEFILYPTSVTDAATQLSTQIAAGSKLPDIILGINLKGVGNTYGRDGYFADLTPYFLDTDGAAKNFWDRMNACLTQDERDYVMRTIYDAESSAIYSVPTVSTDGFNTDCMAWINQEWLDVLELDMPTNMQEFYDVLVAFKNNDPNGNGFKDEIPLLGAEKVMGGQITDWLINMFMYYDDESLWQPDENGKLQPVFTQDSYREALKFVHKLHKEGLLSSMVFSLGSADMRSLLNTDTSNVGVLCANTSVLAQSGVSSETLEKYEPIVNWGYTVENDITCKADTYISADADVAAAFKVLMTLFSEEGTLRMYYGEKGTDWNDEDVWGKSYSGVRANVEILEDVKDGFNNHWWGFQASGILDLDGSAATAVETETDEDEWLLEDLYHGTKYVQWGVYDKTPDNACPTLWSDEVYIAQNQVKNQAAQALAEFALGQKDPNNDGDWADYLDMLDTMGLTNATAAIQALYDAQAECLAGEHLFANATCTEAQKCIFCGKTQGEAKGHSYSGSKCSRCEKAEPALVGTRFSVLKEGEYQWSKPTVTFYEDGSVYFSVSYYESVTGDSLDYYSYYDWIWFDGMPFAELTSGTWREGEYTVSGDAVTVEIYDGTFTLTKTAPDTYEVTNTTIDPESSTYLPAGTVLTAE